MSSAPGKGSADEPLSGLEFLKEVWNIRKKPRERERPPPNVNTDIYKRSPPKSTVPPRPHKIKDVD